MVKLSAVGSAQEVAWLRMPAKRLAIGPGFIPHEHVIVLDPSMRSTSLIHVSHDYFYNTDLVDSPTTAIQQLLRSETRKYKSCDYHIHPRIVPETAVATRPQAPSHTTQTRLRRCRKEKNTPSDRQEPSTGSLPLSLLPVGTATTPLNKP